MLRSIQGIAYCMQVQSDRINVTASNIANISTGAYKKEVVSIRSFDDVLASIVQYDTKKPIGTLGPLSLGSAIGERRIIYEQGFLQQTDFDTDFGIRGDGFFVVETPSGIQYTRAGNFTFDRDGYLVTQEGYYVLGENGRIHIPDRSLVVDLNGNIQNVPIDGDPWYVDRFQVVYFNDLNRLQRIGTGYYTTDDANVNTMGTSDILQKHLEVSNVDIVKETQDLLEARRNFESCQQIIKMIDDTVGKAANEIGKI